MQGGRRCRQQASRALVALLAPSAVEIPGRFSPTDIREFHSARCKGLLSG